MLRNSSNIVATANLVGAVRILICTESILNAGPGPQNVVSQYLWNIALSVPLTNRSSRFAPQAVADMSLVITPPSVSQSPQACPSHPRCQTAPSVPLPNTSRRSGPQLSTVGLPTIA